MNLFFGFGPKSSLLLIFFFHGIVFSCLVLRRGILYNNTAAKLLSLLLLLFALYITPYMCGYAGWYSEQFTREILFFIPFMQVFLIGPVVYFYTKNLLNNEFKFSKKDILHFIPAILYALYSLVVFVTDKLILEEFYFYANGRDKDLANWYQATGLFSMTSYLILSLRHYAHYKRLIFNQLSYAEGLLFRWIRDFLALFLLLLILRLLFFIINPNWGEFGSQFWYYISFSVVFYFVAIAGYGNVIKQNALTGKREKAYNVFSVENNEEDSPPKPQEEQSDRLWQERLQQLMREKQLFTNPKLTLLDVANELETTTKTISTVVNSSFDMNFNDFVNLHRVEAVKEKMKNQEHQNSTLLGLAFDSGFNSKATFNRAFKKHTNLSPKDYLQKEAEN